ncbi:hypothetical protein [Neobacillus mesonae]|uniref:hypothetical protein n=1 Tax=Neobacillus mesonae TaxID=1193713 RepID=UPI002E22B9F6|nr:hypothetical protein [Neobacillus mesonae]
MMCPGDNFDIVNEFKKRIMIHPDDKISKIIEELYQETLTDLQFNEIEKEILSGIFCNIGILIPMYIKRHPDASHLETYMHLYYEISKLFDFVIENKLLYT